MTAFRGSLIVPLLLAIAATVPASSAAPELPPAVMLQTLARAGRCLCLDSVLSIRSARLLRV